MPSRNTAATGASARHVVMLAFDGAQILDITGPLEAFSVASRVLRNAGHVEGDAYTVEVVALKKGPIRMSSGIELCASRSIRRWKGEIDTLLVPGGRGTNAAAEDATILSWIQREVPKANRYGSVCTGALLLAKAGLLDGKRVTTHWAFCERLQQQFPKLTVEPDPIFVCDGNLYTSAGVTAGMDLALGLVEEDWGREIALEVARWMVLFLKRPGGQSQFSAQLSAQMAEREPLRELQSWILENLESDLSVEALAHRMCMSPRNFARVFTRETGVTPARFVERARVEAARRQLEESDSGVQAVAAACGFGSPETMRRAFRRSVHVSPAEYRNRFNSRSQQSRQGARR